METNMLNELINNTVKISSYSSEKISKQTGRNFELTPFCIPSFKIDIPKDDLSKIETDLAKISIVPNLAGENVTYAYSKNDYESTIIQKDDKINDLKQKLHDEKFINDLIRKDYFIALNDLRLCNNKINELNDEIIKLKSMIDYCKHNGIWAEEN